MLRSAATRIAVAGGTAFAMAIALLGAASYLIVDHALRVQLDDRISAEVSLLRSEYRKEGDHSLRQVIEDRQSARANNDLGYALFDSSGNRIAGSLQTSRPSRSGWQTLSYFDPPEGYSEPGRALVVDLTAGRRLVVVADLEAEQDADQLVLALLAMALGLTILIGIVFAFLLAVYLRRRLAVMVEGADAIVSGDLDRRIPIGRRDDEFDRLAMALNAMLDRIAGLLGNLRRVSGDVAHDLRQPLTRLRNILELGLAGGDPHVAIDRGLAQVDQVLSVFGSLLRLSEIEAGKLRATFKAVDIARLVAELGESYQPAVEDEGRALTVRVEPTRAIRGDAELLSQALVNLLDNAQRHTPAQTTIELTVSECAGRVVTSVRDDGPGISTADRTRVIERFVRLEASRNRPGHGLGLSLVAAIAEAHGGRLVLDDARPGLVASIELPA